MQHCEWVFQYVRTPISVSAEYQENLNQRNLAFAPGITGAD
jgi:hypothetical protein